MSNTGFKCGLSGVILQLASMPASLYGHGLLAALLASVGLSLTYLGLRSTALSRNALLFENSYRYLTASLIAYALITTPAIITSQILYFLGYGSLTYLRDVNADPPLQDH